MKQEDKEEKKQYILQQIEMLSMQQFQSRLENSVNDIDNILEKNKQSKNKTLTSLQQPSYNINAKYEIDPSNYVNPLFLLENRKSKVVYVRGLDDLSITIRFILNVFGNFGNVLKIIFLRNKSSCLIEFEQLEQATKSKDSLDNISLLGQTIRVFYSNYETINLRDQKFCESEDVFVNEEINFRFKPNSQISFNPPSQILHVSNLKAETCCEAVMGDVFSAYGKIEATKIVSQDNLKKLSSKYMCLIKFSKLEEALIAMGFLHGTDLLGRKMVLSFTRSKI